MVVVLQLSIKQELKLSEPGLQVKKDKNAVKDLMVCPKKKKRKQRSPAKVQVRKSLEEIHCGITVGFIDILVCCRIEKLFYRTHRFPQKLL